MVDVAAADTSLALFANTLPDLKGVVVLSATITDELRFPARSAYFGAKLQYQWWRQQLVPVQRDLLHRQLKLTH